MEVHLIHHLAFQPAVLSIGQEAVTPSIRRATLGTYLALVLILLAAYPNGLIFFSLPQNGTNEAVIPLPPRGTTTARQLSNDTPHEYEIELAANQFLAVVLRKGDLHVAARVYSPEEQLLGEFVSMRYEPLFISFVSQRAGKHRLEIRSLEKNNSSRPYDLEVETQESPTEYDLKVLNARRLTMEAGRLRSEWKESSNREALLKYSEAISFWRRLGQNEEAADTMEARGDICFSMSEYQQARENYLDAATTTSNRQLRLRFLNRAAYVDIYVGRIRQALARATSSLSYYTSRHSSANNANDQRNEAEVNNTAGEAAYSLGRLRQSITFVHRALELWTLAGDRNGQALAHLNLGYAYSDLGELAKAQDHFGTALTLWREIDDRRGEALALTAHGTIHSFLGEKQAALDNHVQAMNLFRAIGDRSGEAVTRNSIGSAYEDLNQPQIAVDNYERALEIYQQIGNHGFEAVARYYLGGVNRNLGDNQEALKYFKQSLKLSRLVGQPRITAYALSAISALRNSEGHHSEALRWLNQALAVHRGVGDRRGQATALNDLGRLYDSLGNKKEAIKYCKQALPLARASGDRQIEAATLYQMALIARESGLFEEALQYVKQSIEVIESLRAQIISPDLRASYFASVHKYSELYIDLLMKLDKLQPEKHFAELAFETSESARARALLEIISEAGTNIKQGVDQDLLTRERSLQQQLRAKAAYQIRSLEAGDKTEIDIAEREIRELTTAYQELQTQIKQQSPRYADLVHAQPLKLSEIQSELRDRDTLLLEYFITDEASYVWAVSSDSFASFPLPGRDRVESMSRDVYKLLTVRQALVENGSADYQEQAIAADEEYWKKAAALSDIVLKPVAKLASGKRLLVVADGALQYVPFDALPAPGEMLGHNTEPTEDETPLALQNEVVSLPSASTLAVIRKGGPKTGSGKLVIVVADPVFEPDDPRVASSANTIVTPGSSTDLRYSGVRDVVAPGQTGIPRLLATRQEAEAIMAVTPSGDGLTVMDFAASSAIATSGDLGRYRVVHFATHGVIDTNHPELSGIMLSRFDEKGHNQDGFLQLHDIYNLNLSQTQLVVLSACRTGLGKDVKGEGLVGLTRGFMYAGSKSVIASLWKVDDRATAELMKYFYQGMFAEGLTPAAALRKAKESMWRQPRWRAPFFWAAFVLQGEYKNSIPVPRTNRIRNYSVIIIFVLLLINGAIYTLRRGRKSRLTA